MPWFRFLLVDSRSILYHIVPYGCTALLGKWRSQRHDPSPVSMPAGRTFKINDISTEKGRLFSCGQTQWLPRVVLADIHSLLISSSRVGYLSNNAVGPGRQRCSRLGFTPSSPLRSRQKPRSARYDGTPSTMVGLVLTYILQYED